MEAIDARLLSGALQSLRRTGSIEKELQRDAPRQAMQRLCTWVRVPSPRKPLQTFVPTFLPATAALLDTHGEFYNRASHRLSRAQAVSEDLLTGENPGQAIL